MALQTVAETDFYWEDHGVGEPVIFISGYTACHEFWTQQLATLAPHCRVILFDNPGIGSTIDKGGPLTVRDMAHSIADFMYEIDIPRAHIVGHSMGGALAMCLAALHPNRVKKMVLVNSTSRLRELSRHVLTNLLNLRLSDVKLFTLLNAMVPWYFSNDSIKDGKRPAELVDFFIKNQRSQTLSDQSRQLDAMLAFDGADWIPHIRAETMILAGEDDLITPPEDSAHLHRVIPHASLYTLPGAHHMPLESPHLLNQALLDFLLLQR